VGKYKKYDRFLKHVRSQPLSKKDLRGLSVKIEIDDGKSYSLKELRAQVDLKKHQSSLLPLKSLVGRSDDR